MKYLIDNIVYDRSLFNDDDWWNLIINSNSIGLIEYLTVDECIKKYGHTMNAIQIESLQKHKDNAKFSGYVLRK